MRWWEGQGLELLIPPPLVAAVAAALMWGLARVTPGLAAPIPAAPWIGAALAALGLGVELSGVLVFLRQRTTVNPLRPSRASALVTGGIYRWTRNPMYLGWLPILAGWAAYLEHLPALAGVPLFALYITRFQILPEERAMEAKFGEAFRAYRSRVRRWL